MMSLYKKYLTLFCTAVFTIASLGVQVELYHCTGCKTVRAANCCSSAATQNPHRAAVTCTPCSSLVNLSSPIKENTPPNFHKIVKTNFISIAVLHTSEAATHSSTSGARRILAEEFLPPPLSRSSVLRI